MEGIAIDLSIFPYNMRTSSFFLRELAPNKTTQSQKYEYMNAHTFFFFNFMKNKI